MTGGTISVIQCVQKGVTRSHKVASMPPVCDWWWSWTFDINCNKFKTFKKQRKRFHRKRHKDNKRRENRQYKGNETFLMLTTF